MSDNKAEATQGVVFNIQHYSIHDGPGIRTTVFLKGCPLRCHWCQNPESQSGRPEIFFDSEKCIGCGKCLEVCPTGAIEIYGGHSRMNRMLCRGNAKCAEVCPNDARNLMGMYVTAGGVFKDIAEDKIFYQQSGGGVTLGGGEPLAQPRFSISLLKLSKDAGIHTALDTCGYAKWEILKELLSYVDLVLYDFKHMDPVEHERCTGVPNELMLNNARKIHHELSIPILARIPIIPGCNDSERNIEATARFVAAELGSSTRVHLLPCHRLGNAKHTRLERPGELLTFDPPSEEHMLELEKIVASFGLATQIGG